jgi:hypothetical protein
MMVMLTMMMMSFSVCFFDDLALALGVWGYKGVVFIKEEDAMQCNATHDRYPC